MADSDRLTGEDRGDARQTLQHIFDRLGSVLGGRPVALVWTKADKEPKPEIKKSVRDAALLVRNPIHAVPYEGWSVNLNPVRSTVLVPGANPERNA